MTRAKAQEKFAAVWNDVHPIGTKVQVYRLVKPRREPYEKTMETRSAAWVLGGHTAVVMVEGVSGCVSLESVVPV